MIRDLFRIVVNCGDTRLLINFKNLWGYVELWALFSFNKIIVISNSLICTVEIG